MIPGETHKVKLDPCKPGNEYARRYHVELKTNDNIRNMIFDMIYHSEMTHEALSYTLQMYEDDAYERLIRDIDLEVVVDKVDKRIVKISKHIDAKRGHYLLRLKNDDIDHPTKVAFRFVVNGVREIEENGVLSGTLQPGQSNDMQLMVTNSGYLNLTLMSCGRKLVVYRAPATYLKKNLKESEKVIQLGSLTQSGLTAPPSTTHSFADYTSAGPLYFRIENQDTEAADYTLISHINYLTRDYMVGGLFSLLPVHIFMDNQGTNSLSVKAYGPALNKAALDIFYPKVTDVRISMTIILHVNNSINIKDSDDSLQMIKYCGDSVLKSHGYRLTEDHFSVSAQNYIDSQQLRQFTLSLADASSSRHQDIDRQSELSVTVKATVDLYEDVDFDAVASFVDYSPSAAVPASMAGSRSMLDSMAVCWLVSILTGVFVIGVLVAVYVVAGKMSRRYVNVSGGGVGSGRVLEMAENDSGGQTGRDDVSV